MTLEEFAEHAEDFARRHGESGTFSVRHLQRLIAGPGGAAPRPATRRLLERLLDAPITELLGPPGVRRPSAGVPAEAQVAADVVLWQDVHASTGDLLAALDPTDALAAIDESTESVAARYEVVGPTLLAPEVLALRRVCRDLGQRVARSARGRVVRAAARQAALLSYMAVNRDRYAEAHAFAFEASVLATAAKDDDLLAWVRGTQSLMAYYQGRYRDALRLAEAGLAIRGAGSQRVRLLSNGVARAAGKLGEGRVVDRAVDDALSLARQDGPAGGMTPCITFGGYGPARATANAATAHLSAGRSSTAIELTDQLDPLIAGSDSEWSRSLVRLDAASAHARGGGADLERAVSLGLSALAESAGNPIASIGKRAAELADDPESTAGRTRPLLELRAAVRSWQSASGFGSWSA